MRLKVNFGTKKEFIRKWLTILRLLFIIEKVDKYLKRYSEVAQW